MEMKMGGVATFAEYLDKLRGRLQAVRKGVSPLEHPDPPMPLVGTGRTLGLRWFIWYYRLFLTLLVTVPVPLIILIFTRGLAFQVAGGVGLLNLLLWSLFWLYGRGPRREWQRTAEIWPAAVVMANNGLFEAGEENLPGVLLVSFDPTLAGDPERLAALAGRVFDLQERTEGSLPEDQERVRRWLAEGQEAAELGRMPVPAALAGNEATCLVGLFFSRSDLPEGVLDRRLWFVAGRPDRDEEVVLLPPVWWHNPANDGLMLGGGEE